MKLDQLSDAINLYLLCKSYYNISFGNEENLDVIRCKELLF